MLYNFKKKYLIIKIIILFFIFLVANINFVHADVLDVSFNAEPSLTGDIDLFWYAGDDIRGNATLEYGTNYDYEKKYVFNITKERGVITFKNLLEDTIYHYRLRQGDNITKHHQFSVMRGGEKADDDDDNDGVTNDRDNCRFVKNVEQKDADRDGKGDACDNDEYEYGDDDNDGITNDRDNCRYIKNINQKDTDGDGRGDICDIDDDNDEINDDNDNCQFHKNFDQKDTDGDGEGDVCDSEKRIQECLEGARITNDYLYERLRGKIILKVEELGQAFYINPRQKTMHCLGNPIEAFNIMRLLSIGINNEDLSKVPIGYILLSGDDFDGDGLSNIFEDAVWSDKNLRDSNYDGINDKDEIIKTKRAIGRYKEIDLDYNFTNIHKGEIFLQVHNNGEAWYIYPNEMKRYFLGRPHDAFNIMRDFGLGISSVDFDSLKI